ncbi:MAG TPA: hypothetical protein ENI07_09285, partial [Desulfobacterales bacterium]|nr:hypothetical protein [Desulfobacterales bacterium]
MTDNKTDNLPLRYRFFAELLRPPGWKLVFGIIGLFFATLTLSIGIFLNWESILQRIVETPKAYLNLAIHIIQVMLILSVLMIILKIWRGLPRINIKYLYRLAELNENLKVEIDRIEQVGRHSKEIYSHLLDIYGGVFNTPRELARLKIHPMDIQRIKWAGAFIFSEEGINLENIISNHGRLPKIDDDKLFKHPEPYDLKVKYRNEAEKKRYPDARAGLNLCLERLTHSHDNRAVIDAVIADYGQIMDTSDCLLHETYCFAGIAFDNKLGKLSMAPNDVLRCMPWRDVLHRKEGGAIQALTTPR